MTDATTQANPGRRPTRLLAQCILSAVTVGCGVGLGGCGSSARSGFYELRSIEVTPIAGTGEPLGVELAADLAASSDLYASVPEPR
jgi:hypothetical protein